MGARRGMTDNEALLELVQYGQAVTFYAASGAKALGWLLGYWMWREFLQALFRPQILG